MSGAVGRPVRYRLLPVPLQWALAAYVGITRTSGHYKVGRSLIQQFKWNNASATGGWSADLPRLRAAHPSLVTMPAWVRSIDW